MRSACTSDDDHADCSRRPTSLCARRWNWSINVDSAAGPCTNPWLASAPDPAAVARYVRLQRDRTMFGFLTSGTKEAADPLVSSKIRAQPGCGQLPALDVIGRQQHVMRAFDAMRQLAQVVDLARVQAI